MKKNTILKTAALLVALTIALLTFASCGEKEVSYKTGVDLPSLTSSLEETVSKSDNLTDATDDFLEFFLEVDPSLCESYTLRIPAGAESIDEYAIFEAKTDEDAASILDALTKYLKGRGEAWDGRYNASEKPKLDNAGTFRYGSYVGYVILSTEEKPAFLAAFEKAIKN